MKKSIAILSVLATSAALAATQVESSNTFGFVPVAAASTGLTCVAVPVKGYTTGTAIKIAEILQVTDLTAGDTLYTMNGGAYNEYVLQNDKTWKASQVVTVGADGTFKTASGTPPTEATIAPGGAFWLKTDATTISVMGDATTAASAATITTGWQLIGNPSMTQALKISDLNYDGLSVGDYLSVNGVEYQYTKSGWKNRVTKVAITDDDVIPVGFGAMLYNY